MVTPEERLLILPVLPFFHDIIQLRAIFLGQSQIKIKPTQSAKNLVSLKSVLLLRLHCSDLQLLQYLKLSIQLMEVFGNDMWQRALSCPVHFLVTSLWFLKWRIIMSDNKYYLATCKLQCGQLELKIIFENEIWLLCEYSPSLSLRLNHMDTDRQTKGRVRVIIMFCQNDSVSLLSLSPQPLTGGVRCLNEFRLTTWLDVTYSNFIFTRQVLECLFWFFLSSVCPIRPSALTLCLQLVIHHSFLSCSTCCYVWQTETADYWELKCYMGALSYQILSGLNIIWWLIWLFCLFIVSTLFFSLRFVTQGSSLHPGN